jgi:hypothetical protein
MEATHWYRPTTLHGFTTRTMTEEKKDSESNGIEFGPKRTLAIEIKQKCNSGYANRSHKSQKFSYWNYRRKEHRSFLSVTFTEEDRQFDFQKFWNIYSW